MAEPKLLTPEVREKIVRALLTGLYVEQAVVLAGISRRTFYAWHQRGSLDREANRESVYRAFFEEVERAKTDHERLSLHRINRSGKTDWRAMAWVLERKYPDRWGPKAKLLIDVDIHGASWRLIEAGIGFALGPFPEAQAALKRVLELVADVVAEAKAKHGGELNEAQVEELLPVIEARLAKRDEGAA